VLHSKGLGSAATVGHTVELLSQENMKKAVLACAEWWVA
jgi:hypothetical protein